MKNWDKANAVGFGNDTTECYIDDIMAVVASGAKLVLQTSGRTGDIIKVSQIREEWDLIDLEEWAGDEGKGVYWNKGKPIVEGEVFYSWRLSEGEEILIWWDHDLGDVVLDRATKAVIAEQTRQGAEEICNGVWFYWIT